MTRDVLFFLPSKSFVTSRHDQQVDNMMWKVLTETPSRLGRKVYPRMQLMVDWKGAREKGKWLSWYSPWWQE
jgi:hypothetical protein